ncbi:putative glucan endo-1,3-beta-D-glucosidase [Helianthus anomalus]
MVKVPVKPFRNDAARISSAYAWKFSNLLLLLKSCQIPETAGAFVGVNISTDLSNLPSPEQVVAILISHRKTHVRLYDADNHLLSALSDAGIEVMVSVTNEDVLRIGQSSAAAAYWVKKNVAAFVPATNITAIAVGSEVLSIMPHAARVLAPAMRNLHKALASSNLNYLIKVSTPISMDIIPKPFPPSAATFNTSWNSTISGILDFLKSTNSFFMLNTYPYYGYLQRYFPYRIRAFLTADTCQTNS